MLGYKFDIIATSESKLNNQPTVDINLTGYHTPYCKNTEANKGGTLLYVNQELNYKPREDLELYQSNDLESSFIEIIYQKESNDIIGVIYRHPNMDVNNFIDEKLGLLMHKLSLDKNKKVFISWRFQC